MAEVQQPARVMIAGSDEARLRQIGELLAQQGASVPQGLVVPVAMAADYANRANPDLLLIDISGNVDAAMSAVRESRMSCSAYFIVAGMADDPQQILKCLRDGADEYLDISRLADELPAALARFETRGARQPKPSLGRVIGVLGVTGGVGASTIAANVAALLTRARHTCGLVDLCIQAGDLAAILNVQPQHTLGDFCQHAGRMDRSMLDQMFTRHASGVELLAAPWDPRQAELVSPRGLRQLLAMARARYERVVLDLDNRIDDVQLEGLWQSDPILAVTRLDYLSIRSARRIVDRLGELGIEAKRVRVVANRFGQPRELTVAQAESALGMKVASFVVDDARRVNGSATEGKLVALRSSWPRISRNLSALAHSLNGKL